MCVIEAPNMDRIFMSGADGECVRKLAAKLNASESDIIHYALNTYEAIINLGEEGSDI